MIKDKESAVSQGQTSPKLTFRDQLIEIEPCQTCAELAKVIQAADQANTELAAMRV